MVSYYSSLVTKFLESSSDEIVGKLAKSQSQDIHSMVEIAQTSSWTAQIGLLKSTLSIVPTIQADAGILLEYFIPRRGKRIDAIILVGNIVFVLEFKNNVPNGRTSMYKRNDLEQCEDYALDLRDFHRSSRDKIIVPILVDTSVAKNLPFRWGSDPVQEVLAVNSDRALCEAITKSSPVS